MSIGITDEHQELAASLRKWAASLGALEAVRAAEGRVDERFDDIWAAAEGMGVAAIAVPEAAGGGGGHGGPAGPAAPATLKRARRRRARKYIDESAT